MSSEYKVIVGDIHITEDSFDEITVIFSEICQYVNGFNMSADLVILGDFYDSLKVPTNKELIFGTQLISKLQRFFNHIYIIRGNHGCMGTHNNVDYLTNLEHVIVCNDFFEGNLYCAHASTEYSDMAHGSKQFNKWHINLDEINDGFDGWILLGHQHQFQQLAPRAYHLGAVRRQTFAEVDEKRYFAVLGNSAGASLDLRELTSPTRLQNVTTLEELIAITTNNVKVRFVFTDYQYYKDNIDAVNSEGKRFLSFKKQLKFEKPVSKIEIAKTKTTSINDVVSKWLGKVSSGPSKDIITKVLANKGLYGN